MAHDPPQEGSGFDVDEFICTCDEDGLRAAQTMLAEVKERLSDGTPIFPAQQVTDDVLLTAAVTSLSWSYNAHISNIACEQWSAVFAESYDGTFRTRVACDQVEHGVAATWKAFADHTERQR